MVHSELQMYPNGFLVVNAPPGLGTLPTVQKSIINNVQISLIPMEDAFRKEHMGVELV